MRRAGLRTGVRSVRALPRVLEPRLHGVRAARGRNAHAAAQAEHRHRHGARARRNAAPGRGVDLRHRRVPADHGLDRARVRRRVRIVPGGDEGAPRDHRPRARDDVRDRRGRPAFERGARLRPAAADPAGGRAGPTDWPRSRLPHPGDRGRAGRTVVSGGRRARDEIERVVRAEEERFRETMERGMREFEALAGARSSPASRRSRSQPRTASRSS